MKALVYTAPNTVVYRDEVDPIVRNDEVLVRVSGCGICGSDMHGYHGHDERRPPPLILGHEAVGTIASGPNAGRRVTVNPLVPCGSCEACVDGRMHLCPNRVLLSMPARPGAFAELISAPEANLVAIPDILGDAQAALAEPLAVGWHAANLGVAKLARPVGAGRAVVLGGGAIGLTTALSLVLHGARDIAIAEPHAGRRKAVAAAGPFHAYDPSAPGAPRDGTVDIIFDAVGSDATRAAAFRLVKPGGVIVHIGLLPGAGGVDVRRLTLQEITFVGSYCYTVADFRETVAALGRGHFGPLNWFEERPLSDGARAFADIDAGRVDKAKVLLRM